MHKKQVCFASIHTRGYIQVIHQSFSF